MDFLQTMPGFVWLVPVVKLFSIGVAGAMVATVIFALAPAVRLTELGIRQVDKEVVEAGHAFGAAPRQILKDVQLPLALPSVMAGVNQVIMLSLSMAVIGGLVGAPGLGSEVIKSLSTLDLALGFDGGISVVILAIFLDRLTASIGTRRPGRARVRELGHRLTRTPATSPASCPSPLPVPAPPTRAGTPLQNAYPYTTHPRDTKRKDTDDRHDRQADRSGHAGARHEPGPGGLRLPGRR